MINPVDLILAAPGVSEQILAFHLYKGRIRRECGLRDGGTKASGIIQKRLDELWASNAKVLQKIYAESHAKHDLRSTWMRIAILELLRKKRLAL